MSDSWMYQQNGRQFFDHRFHQQYSKPNYFPDRSRSRERQLPYNSYYENNFNDRNYWPNRRNRRSQSASRVCSEGESNHSKPRLMKDNFERQFFSQNENHKQTPRVEAEPQSSQNLTKNEDSTNTIPPLKKFKSIFGPTIENDKTELNETINKENFPDINDLNLEMNKLNSENVDKTIDSLSIATDLSEYYGDSITEVYKSKMITCNKWLPIVDWQKTSYSIHNLPSYSSENVVGGDGLTIELFYMCKYCKMFTDGRQISDHLKSKYHYDRYIEYLTSGRLRDSSSSSSSSSSDNDSKISTSPDKQLLASVKNNSMNSPKEKNLSGNSSTNRSFSLIESDHPSNIVYSCHQELDYDDDKELKE